MAEEKRGKRSKRSKSKYAKKLTIRKRLSGSRGSNSFKGKHSPIPLPLFEDLE